MDPDKDIAVLQIDPALITEKSIQLKPIKLGSSSKLQVGQSTFAIGNPFGLDHTLTTGYNVSNIIMTALTQFYAC